MKKIIICLADGFEEIEAIIPIDLFRRASIDCKIISCTDKSIVSGSHGISFETDCLFDELDFADIDGLILPGGMPGAINLKSHDGVRALIYKFINDKKLVAAICAAPRILGEMGLLNGRSATCYPGNEVFLCGANISNEDVCVDGMIVTSRGVGTAIPFSLKIIEMLLGTDKMEEIKNSILF